MTDATEMRSSFVLLHGAWHTGAVWNGVAESLRDQGHRAEAPDLPSVRGTRVVRFSDYVDAVVETVRRQRTRVTLVGHSSAGMLVQAASPHVAEQLERVVFSNAFILADGESQLDHMPAQAVTALRMTAQGSADKTIPAAVVEAFFRSVLMEGEPVELQDALIAQLVPQPFSLLCTPVATHAFAKLELKRDVLFCTRDRSANYLATAAQMPSYRVLPVEGSHELMFTDPNAYATALLTIAQPEP